MQIRDARREIGLVVTTEEDGRLLIARPGPGFYAAVTIRDDRRRCRVGTGAPVDGAVTFGPGAPALSATRTGDEDQLHDPSIHWREVRPLIQ